jgi:hypothetical protein
MNDFLKSIAALFLICGVMLFWYIDWYWVVILYNILFSYFSLTVYLEYNDDPRFRKKIPLVIYIGLPLVLNFVGFLISIINGFEEIPSEEIMKRKNIGKDDVENVLKHKNVKSPYFKKFN